MNPDSGQTNFAWTRKLRENLKCYIFLLPATVVFFTFYFLPVIYSVYISFFKWDMLSPPTYLALENYNELLHNPEFWHSLIVTFVYMAGTIPTRMALGLALALLINTGIRGTAFYRTAFFLPYVTSIAAVCVVWRWMLNPFWGPINLVLANFGISNIKWLEDVRSALPSIISLGTWRMSGYIMVIFYAGLKNIPSELYETARIDGASNWICFRHITWPLLSPTTFFIFIISLIETFKVFNPVFILTGGGPLESTRVSVFFLYQYAFRYMKIGYACAAAVILMVIIFVFSAIQLKYVSKRVYYD